MKRNIVLVLLVPILALTLISCDADMRSGFASFLGGLGGNVYSSVVTPDYSGLDEADNAIANLPTDAPPETVTGKAKVFGDVEIPFTGGATVIAPLDAPEQAALKNTIKEATKNDDKKQKFAEEQKKPASDKQQKAAVGTIAAINATIDEVADGAAKELLEKLKLPDIDEGSITQADVLILQLMTDLIVDTLGALDGGGVIDEGKVESLINDALFTIEIAETLSGASSIIFTDEISLFDLMPKDGGGDKSARGTAELDDPDGRLHTIRGIFPSLIKMMGVTRNGNTYTYSAASYNSFVLNQRAYRASMEQAIKLDAGNNNLKETAKFSDNTLIKYVVSVLITENHEYLKSLADRDVTGDGVIRDFLNANPGFGNAPTPNNKITQIDYGTLDSIYEEAELKTFLTNWGKASFVGILETLKGINSNIVDKYQVEVISEEIGKLLDDLKDKTDDDWFDEIFGD